MNLRMNKNNTSSPNERSKFDMDQAMSMKGMSRKSTFPSSPSSNMMRTKINNSLTGLDVADDYAKNGKLHQARAKYEEHISELIDILNKMKTIDKEDAAIDGISRDVLRERTKAALTDAEKIKEQINLRGGEKIQNHDKELKAVELTHSSSLLQTNNNKTKSRFFSFGKSNSNKEIETKKPTQQTHLIKTSKSADYESPPSKPSQPRKRSNLDYTSNDPFITTIKKDIYVDSSRLKTTWTDVAGLVNAKRALQEAAILPLLRPDLYTGLRSPPKGILLYGPPGTGKTMLVKAVAHESRCILFACSAASMTSKWVGEGEKLVRTLFRMAADVAPSIIFLDELDSLLGRRKSDGNNEAESSRRFKTEFMVQLDGISAGSGDESKKMLMIGATNCPWDIDDAIMRRFQRRVYVPLPDSEARLALWNRISKSESNITMSSTDIRELVKLTEGFSCSDIASIANEASFGPLRELGDIDVIKDVQKQDVRPIQFKDFKTAILSSKKSVSNELLRKYETWENTQATR
jgi:SpoVK/Ycf46/Vps4 family AAA+-type ATPase